MRYASPGNRRFNSAIACPRSAAWSSTVPIPFVSPRRGYGTYTSTVPLDASPIPRVSCTSRLPPARSMSRLFNGSLETGEGASSVAMPSGSNAPRNSGLHGNRSSVGSHPAELPRRRQEDKPTTLAPDVASRGRRKGVRRVSPVPFGLGFMKPHNYREVFRSAWNNQRRPFFTWRILHDGVCDGCALGTTGLRDFPMEGIHLCTVRLDLLPLNTMGPLRIRRLADVNLLRSKSSKELRELGRLPYPMVRHHGDRGFRRIPWEDALQFAARRIRATSPDRLAFFVTSRGMTNESYYVANKVARFLGTNQIGRASCREREEIEEVRVSCKKQRRST